MHAQIRFQLQITAETDSVQVENHNIPYVTGRKRKPWLMLWYQLLNATRRRGLTLALPDDWAKFIPYRPEEEKV